MKFLCAILSIALAIPVFCAGCKGDPPKAPEREFREIYVGELNLREGDEWDVSTSEKIAIEAKGAEQIKLSFAWGKESDKVEIPPMFQVLKGDTVETSGFCKFNSETKRLTSDIINAPKAPGEYQFVMWFPLHESAKIEGTFTVSQ